MAMTTVVAACLALVAPPTLLKQTTVSSRSSPLVAPMSSVTDVPRLVVSLPQHGVADMALRTAVYMTRMFAGATGTDGAAALIQPVIDTRTLLTSSTVGTFRSGRSVASALKTGGTPIVDMVQMSAMLLHHPIMLGRWASRRAAEHGFAVSAPASGMLSSCSICGGLWLVWIMCTAIKSARLLRTAEGGERKALTLTLSRFVLDVPLAVHFISGAALLPMLAVGVLGTVSSLMAVRAALANPVKDQATGQKVTPRLTLMLPHMAVAPRRYLHGARNSLRCAVGQAKTDWHIGMPCSPRCAVASNILPRAHPERRKIGGGPLSGSCEW